MKLIFKPRVIKKIKINKTWNFKHSWLIPFIMLQPLLDNRHNVYSSVPWLNHRARLSSMKYTLKRLGPILLGTKEKRASRKEVEIFQTRYIKIMNEQQKDIFKKKSKRTWKKIFSLIKPKRIINKEEQREQNLREWVKPDATFGMAMANLWEELATNPFKHKPYLHNNLLKFLNTMGDFNVQRILPNWTVRNYAYWTKFKKKKKTRSIRLNVISKIKSLDKNSKKIKKLGKIKKTKKMATKSPRLFRFYLLPYLKLPLTGPAWLRREWSGLSGPPKLRLPPLDEG